MEKRNYGRHLVGVGPIIVGAGLLIGAILAFLFGVNPIDYFGRNLAGMDAPAISEQVGLEEPSETEPSY